MFTTAETNRPPFQPLLHAGHGCYFLPIRFETVIFPPGVLFSVGSSELLLEECAALELLIHQSIGQHSPGDWASLLQICRVLCEASKASIQHQVPTLLYWDHQEWDGAQAISDRSASAQGFTEFVECSPDESGDNLLVTFQSGAQHRIPADHLRLWSDPAGTTVTANLIRFLIGSSRIEDNHIRVTVVFSNGDEQEVTWDGVLMGCEPQHEHLGGFTEVAKSVTGLWMERRGPFRVRP
jgi:hypothetical protein